MYGASPVPARFLLQLGLIPMPIDDKNDFFPTQTIPKRRGAAKPDRPAKAYMAVLTGAKAGSQYPLLNDRQTVIGRSPGCEIHIDDTDASRRHAAVQPFGNDYYLMDMGSTNGTLVNGKPVEKRILKHGDKITLGKQVLQFIILGPDGGPYAGELMKG